MTRKERQQRQFVAERTEMSQEILAHTLEESLKHFEQRAIESSKLESSSADLYRELLTEIVRIAAITKALAEYDSKAIKAFIPELNSSGKNRKSEPSPSIELLLKAFRIAGSTQKLAAWIQTPIPALNGETPYALMQSEEGRKQVDAVLSRIEHGVY